MCKGIMFPSLPVSTLYGTIIETWFDEVFIRFGDISDHLLLKVIEFKKQYKGPLTAVPVVFYDSSSSLSALHI